MRKMTNEQCSLIKLSCSNVLQRLNDEDNPYKPAIGSIISYPILDM